MQSIMNNAPAVVLILLIVAAVILTIALLRADKREKQLGERIQDVEKALSEQLRSTLWQNDEQVSRGREEISANMRGMGDSVTRVMSEMARTQQVQLDQFAGQIRDMNQADEARMHEIRKSVETRLQSYEDRMDRIGDVLDDKLDRNEQRLERVRQTVEQQMHAMQESNNSRLDAMRHSVDQRLDETLDQRLGESFRLVNERLAQVYQGLGEMQTLASGVGDLKRIMTNVKSRGLTGEIQLNALLAQLMSAEQYRMNVVVKRDRDPVDFAVVLPGRSAKDATSLLPIDAKFPHEAYYRLLDAQNGSDAQLIEQLGNELEHKLIHAAERIDADFIEAPLTTDFAVLFLGSEGLYAEAIRRPGLAERLQRDFHVTLTGPSTLAALINSLQMGFRTLALERRSEEVWALLGAVKGEIGNFADALARTQKRIRQAGESLDDATKKTRVIERRLKGVERLKEAPRRTLLDELDEEDATSVDPADAW